MPEYRKFLRTNRRRSFSVRSHRAKHTHSSFLSSQNYKNPGAAFLKQEQPEAPGFSNRSIQFQHAGIQLIVGALKLKKLVMRTAFDNASVIEHHNRVRIAYS